ncbi:hypothetical protein HY623_02625 [Candidatus Uhrbacteria bacterium]|nr:hypothetical protein [Candidatus Uhrbacteria bacterium]
MKKTYVGRQSAGNPFSKKNGTPQRLYVGPVAYTGMIESDLKGNLETSITPMNMEKRVIPTAYDAD